MTTFKKEFTMPNGTKYTLSQQSDMPVLMSLGELKMSKQITPRSLELFLAYARDAGNWRGTPLIGGNVGGSKEDRGNLTQLKRAGLVTSFDDGEGCQWLQFTDAGKALAIQHGVDGAEFVS